MIYLDNAATTSKKPPNVKKTVEYAIDNLSANPGRSGHSLSVKAADAVYRTREKTASFFGTEGAENVVFTMNCTHSINCVLKGELKRGDHVIVSSFEHNAVMRPLVKTGILYSVAAVSLESDDETVENFAEKIKPNTKMIFCTGASNVFGKMLPIAKLGKLCKERGILFGVDAAQIAGVIPLNMEKDNIDFLCVAPHKGLYAPMGTGVLIARKPITGTVIEGGTGTNSIDMFQPESLPERLESGTLNVPGIAGISAGLDFVTNRGIDKIYTHELSLIQKAYTGLSKISEIRLYTPFPEKGKYAPVLSFNVKGLDSPIVGEMLSKHGIATRGGLHCAPAAHNFMNTLETGAVRISTGAFNTESEISSFLRILKEKILKKA